MTSNLKQNKNRIIEIDILRGVAILFMMLDHFIYDIFGFMPFIFTDFPKKDGLSNTIFNFAIDYWKMDLRYFVRYIIVFLFMALVGICASFSKNNIKRGLKLLGVSLVLSILTYIVSVIIEDPSTFISFGTLHCIAISLLFCGFLLKYFKNRWVY